MMPERENVILKALEWVVVFIVTINVGLTTWSLKSIVDLQTTVAELRGNRFTTGDGLVVWKEIATIREQIAKLPNDFPPKWFEKRVDELAAVMEKNGQKLDELSRRVDALPQKAVRSTP